MELKTSEIVGVYKLLGDAKLTKMGSGDKFKVIKMMRAMKPVADEWDSFLTTVDDKLKKENHDDMVKKAQQWQQEGEKTTLTEEERIEVNTYFMEYQKEKDDIIGEELKKVVTLNFEKISQESFEKLIDSNDLEVNKIMMLQAVLSE